MKNQTRKKIYALIMCASILAPQFSFAARLGGGKSYGMQKSRVSSNRSSYQPQQQYSRPNYSNNNYGNRQSYQKPRMGTGTAAALGVAAGAAGGYLLAKSANNSEQRVSQQQPIVSNNSQEQLAPPVANNNDQMQSNSTPAPKPKSGGMPWGIIIILGGLLGIGLMLFRKNKNTNLATNNAYDNNNLNNSYTQPNNSFNMTTPVNNNVTTNNNYQPAQTNSMDIMPDGVETIYFLRQVKGTFLHVQSMNNPDNVSEVAKYMTRELYTQIQAAVMNNSYVADFSKLDCSLIECENLNGELIASVRFFGLVSDEPNQPAVPFSEIWNFVKSNSTGNKWLIAGIQQEQ